MYPNQGFPGQQHPFSAGYGYPPASQQPFADQMPLPVTQGPGQPFHYQGPPAGQNVYPPQQPGYPPQQPGYPPQQPGYPPQQPGYPPQQPGYPPQQQGYPPQQPGYPPQQPGYPPQQPGYPPQQPGYSPQQYPQQPPMSQAYPQAPGCPPQEIIMATRTAQNFAAAPQPHSNIIQQPRRARPTVFPMPNFNAPNDCAALRKAMRGFGTDENGIIDVLCHRTNAQRIELIRTFKTSYGKDLISEIKSETSGNFQLLLVTLLTQTYELYARELYEAMEGKGTDETVLIEVLCTMTNYEIKMIFATFTRMYGKSLEHELQSDTSGCFKRLMTSLANGSRDESMVTDINQAKIDAEELKRAGIDKWGTDESTFNCILCQRNYEQLKLISREYQILTGNSLDKDIKREFSGDIKDGLLALLRVAENRPLFFARRLYKSMAGLGTDDRSLIRLVVTRSEIDMMDIKDEFFRKYGKTLKSFIKGDCSGHYKHALYALIGEHRG